MLHSIANFSFRISVFSLVSYFHLFSFRVISWSKDGPSLVSYFYLFSFRVISWSDGPSGMSLLTLYLIVNPIS